MSDTRCALTDKSTQIVDTRKRQLLRLQRRFQAVSLFFFRLLQEEVLNYYCSNYG